MQKLETELKEMHAVRLEEGELAGARVHSHTHTQHVFTKLEAHERGEIRAFYCL